MCVTESRMFAQCGENMSLVENGSDDTMEFEKFENCEDM